MVGCCQDGRAVVVDVGDGVDDDVVAVAVVLLLPTIACRLILLAILLWVFIDDVGFDAAVVAVVA